MWIVFALEKLTRMAMTFSSVRRIASAAAAAALLLASGAAHSTGTRALPHTGTRALPQPSGLALLAEEAFPDAALGVDPVVTGPTSSSFKKQQQAFNCSKAVWPNIPLACYPAR
jgi:hypothetical protein